MANLNFQAVIFDMDGVITQTSTIHSLAWKRMFDEYLKYREDEFGEHFDEFSLPEDYLLYVDGKLRYEGVADFLNSRGINLPPGDPNDPPEKLTYCGLGNRKNIAFQEIVKRDGLKVYPSTKRLIMELIDADIPIGVASSSKNCKSLLQNVGLLDLFSARVDGVVSIQRGLRGKPEPDIFITACEILGVECSKSIVIEDAVSGVQAGSSGNFGLTLGVAREDNAEELLNNGADYVVNDLNELDGISGLNELFVKITS